jgi:diguanylate cyclase
MQKTKNNITQEPLTLDAEIANLLYSNNARSLLASIIVAISLVIIQYKLISPTKLLIWVGIFTTAYSLRALLTTRYYKSPSKDRDATKWLERYRLFSGFCGFSWGSAGVLLFPQGDLALQASLIFALVGVAGGAVIVYSIDAVCSNLFIGSLLIPTTFQLMISGSHFTIIAAILFVVYIIYITIAGRQLAKSLRDNITLRIAAGHDHERVHKLAYYDVLTNLPNRRLLSEYLSQTFHDCERLQSYGALLFLDLDDFKNINDLKGHNAGDQLLQNVARRLQACLRNDDFIARVGGDEFVVVVHDVGSDELNAYQSSQTVAEGLIDAIGQPILIDGFHYKSTPSIGICVFFGEELDEIEVLRRADIAMYQAKRLGRKNTFQFYDDTLNPIFQFRAAIESDLRVALEGNQLIPYYQIQVDQNQKNIGVELLLRWNHPALGFVPPADFIPIAEDSGEILNIGNWVLMQACTQLKLWEKSIIFSSLTLSVNVSALQFNQPDFVKNVIAIVKESGCKPKLLKIELTESLVLQNIEDVINKMKLLKEADISFSLDDFGTGHSSLSVLRRLPIDELKIDQSFISDIQGDNDDKFFAQTIIAIGKNLGLNVIAEGVETEEQKCFLQEYGCHAYQGYFFGKPLPLIAFEASLKT